MWKPKIIIIIIIIIFTSFHHSCCFLLVFLLRQHFTLSFIRLRGQVLLHFSVVFLSSWCFPHTTLDKSRLEQLNLNPITRTNWRKTYWCGLGFSNSYFSVILLNLLKWLGWVNSWATWVNHFFYKDSVEGWVRASSKWAWPLDLCVRAPIWQLRKSPFFFLFSFLRNRKSPLKIRLKTPSEEWYQQLIEGGRILGMAFGLGKDGDWEVIEGKGLVRLRRSVWEKQQSPLH